ncbi:MAG: hypothetical protein ABSG70_11720 [Terriglobales bacterium]|jgi:hypothetical protein
MSSSPSRWRQVERLFYEAPELPPDARSAYLDQNCAGDTKLRAESESLLASAEKPADFLRQSVRDAAHRMMADDRREPEFQTLTKQAFQRHNQFKAAFC